MKRVFRAESIVFTVVWLILIIFGRTMLFRDPGTFWHLSVGHGILSSYHLPTTDTFSFTFYGQPWAAHEWLMEVLMAFIYGRFGFDGLLLGTAAALAGLYTWLFSRLRRAGLNLPVATLLLALVLAASSHHFHVRPHILSLIFLGLTFAWLCDFEAGRKNLRSLFWLWPLFIIWTNSHGGVLGGLGILGLAAGGWTLAYLLHKDSHIKTPKELLGLVVLVLGAILTILINPYGAELPRTWLAILGSPVVPQLVQEHAPISQDLLKHWSVLALGALYLATLLGTLPRRPRATWLIPLVWLFLAWSRVRNAPLFALTAAIALAEFYPQVRWAGWFADRGSAIFRRLPAASPFPFTPRSLLLPVAAVLLTAIISTASLNLGGRGLSRLDSLHWPLELLPELRQFAQSRPAGAAIMNDMLFGGFLIFYTPRSGSLSMTAANSTATASFLSTTRPSPPLSRAGSAAPGLRRPSPSRGRPWRPISGRPAVGAWRSAPPPPTCTINRAPEAGRG